MTTTPPDLPPTPDPAPTPLPGNALVEVAGLLLIVLGVVGASVVGFVTDWRAGVGVLSAASLAAGYLMTFRQQA